MRIADAWPWVLAWLVVFVAFVALAIRAAIGGVPSIDLNVARDVQDAPDLIGPACDFANWLGSPAPVTFITLGGVLLLVLRRYRVDALLVFLTILVRSLAEGVKFLVDEPRPTASLVHVSGSFTNPSFPSGHVVGATVLFGLFILYAPRVLPWPAAVWALRAFSVFMIAIIGVARVWTGAHWPTDVVGGYLFALLFLLPAIVLERPLRAEHHIIPKLC